MAMNPINHSPQLRQGVIDAFQGTQRRDQGAVEEAGGGNGRPAASRAPTDRAEISETAHKLVELRRALDGGRAAAAEEPDMRDDKLAKVRERLAQGYYNSVEVRDKVAGGVDQVIQGMEKL